MVVMLDVVAKQPFKMPSVEDKVVVEAFRANRAHKPFGVGVGIWRSERSLEDLGSLGPEDLVEASDVFGVPVTNKEPRDDAIIGQVHGQVPRLLCDPRADRMTCDVGDPHSTTA